MFGVSWLGPLECCNAAAFVVVALAAKVVVVVAVGFCCVGGSCCWHLGSTKASQIEGAVMDTVGVSRVFTKD